MTTALAIAAAIAIMVAATIAAGIAGARSTKEFDELRDAVAKLKAAVRDSVTGAK